MAIPYFDNSEGTTPPAGWLRTHIRNWFAGTIEDRNRGEPAPYDKRDMYAAGQPPVAQPVPFGAYVFRLTRRYDRGADAYAVRGGILNYDPLGAGVPYTRLLPSMQPAAIKLPFGDALFWAPQEISYGATPAVGSPIYTPAQLAALLGNPALAGNTLYGAPYIAPPVNGFGG